MLKQPENSRKSLTDQSDQLICVDHCSSHYIEWQQNEYEMSTALVDEMATGRQQTDRMAIFQESSLDQTSFNQLSSKSDLFESSPISNQDQDLKSRKIYWSRS